jgi:hypothetical protein
MRVALSLACISFIVASSSAQVLERVYNRDSHEAFVLKNVKNRTQVLGPIVRQNTVFTFDNPYTKLTEASVWFSLNWAAVLSGFGYWYKDEYVPGILMDKNKAWFIYTAITSRNEDPGIMVQTAPSSYHAQIYPLAVGRDLRVELKSIGFLQPEADKLIVPQPSGAPNVPYDMTFTSAKPETIHTDGEGVNQRYTVDLPKSKPLDMKLYAQRHKDGWVYVAGLVRRQSETQPIKLSGLKNVLWTKPTQGDTSARYFIGRRKGSGQVSVQTPQAKRVQQVKANARGTDTSKLWAHQRLVQQSFASRKEVLDFSMKYQVPSAQTALLAVPEEQMKLFRQKAAEFKRVEAEKARREREWQKTRQQNWRSSGGGDPEIRVSLPNAIRAYALLPDGRRIDLRQGEDGFWGGSYDIPADAPEGEYKIRVFAEMPDAKSVESSVEYEVDRTAPQGKAEILGSVLTVRSEPKLGRVVAVLSDGRELDMKESEPGIYTLDLGGATVTSVVLYDSAHNKTILTVK